MGRVATHQCVLAAAAVLCLAQTAFGQERSAVEFYKGRNVSVYVGFGPGGGYDLSARTLARYIGRHIPGEPNMLPRLKPRTYSRRQVTQPSALAPLMQFCKTWAL